MFSGRTELSLIVGCRWRYGESNVLPRLNAGAVVNIAHSKISRMGQRYDKSDCGMD
jgi:hypothetical protein